MASSICAPFGRAPQFSAPWAAIWLCALLIFGASIGALEGFWRARGFVPTVPDSPALWAYQRARVVGDEPELIVAIGTSRIRTDICPEVVAEDLHGAHIIQLGINGPNSPIGLLDDLSNIPTFCGLVLCDILPPLLEQQRWYGRTGAGRSPDRRPVAFSAQIGAAELLWQGVMCEHFVVTNPGFSLRRLVSPPPFMGNEPADLYLRTTADRFMTVHYSSDEQRADIKYAALNQYSLLYKQARTYPKVAAFIEHVAPIGEMVRRIRAHHGDVVFLRLPSSGSRLALEESSFPSEVYLTALAHATGAQCIDFRDMSWDPPLDCPDDSHLSAESARRYTRALTRDLRRRGLLRTHSASNNGRRVQRRADV